MKRLLLLTLLASAAHAGGPDPLELGGCPKPVIRHKHKAHELPMCTCVAMPAPKVIFTPTEPDIEPIAAPVYRYYTVSTLVPSEGIETPGTPWGYSYPPGPVMASYLPPPIYGGGAAEPPGEALPPGGGYQPPHVPKVLACPEIHADSAGAGLTLLGLCLLVLTGRRPK